MQREHKQEIYGQQPDLPQERVFPEKAEASSPPVGQHRRGQDAVGGARLLAPEDFEAVGRKRVLGNLGGIAVIGGVVDVERLDGIAIESFLRE